MSNTRPNANANAEPAKFSIGDRVVTDTGFEGRIVGVLPRLETEADDKWIADKERAYKIANDRTTVTETESEISAA